MTDNQMRNYEEVAQFTMSEADCEELLRVQNECSFVWRMRDGWPLGVIMSYVWRDGKVWMTASSQRPRIAAVKRDDRVSVVVSSAGTSLSPRTVTICGRCALFDDAATKDWFYPALANALIPDDSRRQNNFVKMLDSPRRVVLCVTPEKLITFSSDQMREYWRGGAQSD